MNELITGEMMRQIAPLGDLPRQNVFSLLNGYNI